MAATRSETTSAAARNGRSSRHGDTPAAFITMISESELSLLRTCAAAMTSAIGASIMTRSGTIMPVMPTKTSMRLALTGDQVEIAHRLREPDHDRQADKGDQERAHRGAKHIAADRPHRTKHPR